VGDELFLIEITYNGSTVLIMCVVGVWRLMPLKIFQCDYTTTNN